MSVKRKPGPPKEQELCGFFFLEAVLLLGVRKTDSKNSSLKNLTYELGACNYTSSFEIKAVPVAVCLAFYRMNHVSSLGIHYKRQILLRLIVMSGSHLKSSGGGFTENTVYYEDSLKNTVSTTNFNRRNHVVHTAPPLPPPSPPPKET